MSILSVLVLAISAFAIIFAGHATGSSGAPPSVTAFGPRHDLFVGTITLTIQTTNPLQYTLVDEYYIVGGVYSFLINYGPNWELEPDLAVQWSQTNTNPSTWVFHLAKNAYFVDPRGCTVVGGHITDCPTKTQVTAADVKFTWDYVKKNQDATTYFKPCTEHVASVDTTNPLDPSDQFYVKITYDGRYAAALASLTCVPILPKYIWSPGGVDVAVDWTNALPIGSGAYMARPVAGGAFQMVTPPPLILDRNPVWHGKEVQGRQTFPDTIQFVNYETSGAMSVDLTLGKIDLAISPDSQDYLGYLNGKPGILRRQLPDGFEAEQAINVLPDDLRAQIAAISKRPLEHGHSNPVLQNQVVRTAIHMATNRQKMIQNAQSGLASPGDTLLPAFHPWHTAIPPYSSDDKNGDGNAFDFPPFVPLDSQDLEQFPDGPDAPSMARTMLVQAGWDHVCSTGALQTGTEFPLCRLVAGKMVDPLDFRLSTFSTPPWWETAARGVIQDAATAGIRFTLELLNGAQMYSLWYQLDYDVWLWDWVWTPITDASLALVVQTCGGIVTLDNDNGFCMRDPVTKQWTFDDLYNQTLTQTDPVARQALSDRMQRMIYGFASYNLPFYLNQLYAMNRVRFTNWPDDFASFRAVPPDVGNSPLLGQFVYPVDQKPPQFTLSPFEGVVNRPVQFSVAAIDPEGGPLRYRWDFDAGHVTPTGTVGGVDANGDGILGNDDQGGNSPTPTFTYGTAGTYDVALRVSEDGGDFFNVQRTTVTIHPAATGSPVIRGMPFSPTDPTTVIPDLVTLAASASDPQGLAITQYTWNWNDGAAPQTTTGPTASHQYTVPGTYTVQLTVRNSGGVPSSSSTIVPVVDNVAPVLAALQSKAVVVNLPDTFVEFASDANARDILSYSWVFGDGGTGVGNPVTHTYTTQGQFTQTVTVSDGHGHSASSSATINVVADRNTAPRINSLTSTPASTWTTLPVQLTGTVTDAEGNVLLWEWDFNADGIVDKSYTTPLTTPGAVQTKTETYQFTTPGNGHPKLTITDQPPSGSARSTSSTVVVPVAANTAPTLTALSVSPTSSIPGQDITFSSTSNDANGDKISYTWTFGDGSTASGQTGFFGGVISATHAYASSGTYEAVLSGNDGKGGTAGQGVLVTVSDAGLLRVTTGIDLHPTFGVPGKIIVDGIPRDEWSLTWAKMPPGTHTVSFSDVWNLGTPAAQTFTLAAGQTMEIQGLYKDYGWLRVVTNPAVPATIYVNGNFADDWEVWHAVPPADYTIHFGAVAGYDPPPDQTVHVNTEQLTTVPGNYVSNPSAPGPDPATYGLLRVTTALSTDPNAGAPSAISVNGVVRDEWALTWVKVPPGTYTIHFGDVVNIGTPSDQTVTIAAGQTREVTGTFQVRGFLRVDTSPAVAGTIFVNGIPYDDWQVWQSMPVASYKVSFGPVSGYAAPPPVTLSVTAGQLTFYAAPYTAVAVSSSTTTTSALSPASSLSSAGSIASVSISPESYTVSAGLSASSSATGSPPMAREAPGGRRGWVM